MAILQKLTHQVILDYDANRYYQGVLPATYPFKIGTATNCYPRRLVTKDTAANEIKVAAASDTILGVLGYEYAPSGCSGPHPANIDTAYAAGAIVPVIVERGRPLTLMLAPSQSINLGAKLYAAADGCVSGSGTVEVGTALETLSTGAGVYTAIAAIFK